MPTLLIFHEVDDVDHWLASTKRDELMRPRIRSAVSPGGHRADAAT
jgi:hypothetical protein